MSLGFYRVIKGKLVVREHQSPDGDSMRFVANDMSLFEGLPNYAKPKGPDGQASYQLRFQAIDTPETHYGGADQPHGRESRDGLLRWLGVDPSTWDWSVAPDGFSWEHEAAILCDGFDQHGRPIAFVFGELGDDDGAEIKLTSKKLATSYNHHAIQSGNAYVGLYSGGLSFELEQALIGAYQSASKEQRGIWALDKTAQFTVTTLSDLSPEHGSLVYPKIFRRCVDALKWAGGSFRPGRDLDDFLAAKPEENDRIIVRAVHGGTVKTSLRDVLEQTNNQIRIRIDLNTVEFVSK